MLFELQNELRKHLNQNESILWAGKPKNGIIFKSIDIFLIPFSILWTSFSVFWVYIVYNSGTPHVFALFGIPFILIGIFLLIGRFFYDAQQRKSTIYGLTENRIIIKKGVFSSKIHTINLHSLSTIDYRVKKDGSGSIFLGKAKADQTNIIRNYTLDLITDVKKVYNKIIEQQANKK